MTRLPLLTLPVLASVLALTLWGNSPADDSPKNKKESAKESKTEKPDKKSKDLSVFMRMKLDASGKVLEGLATEDFVLIREGARKLNEMSSAEKWRVSNDAIYRNFSTDFQRQTADLSEAADNENIDRAALKWMGVTMSCIECHRYARGVMIVDDQSNSASRP